MFVKFKQLHVLFLLMYLLFRQNECYYCKCGILRHMTILHKRVRIRVKRPIRTSFIWLFLQHGAARSVNFYSPPPRLDGMLVHRKVSLAVNFALKPARSNIFGRNKLITLRSQLLFKFFINVTFFNKGQLYTVFLHCHHH